MAYSYSTGKIILIICSIALGSSFLTPSCRHASFRTKSRSFIAGTQTSGDSEESQNYLSHVQLRVSDINATIQYWVENKGAKLQVYNQRGNSTGAFVGFGANQSDPGFLSLELTQQPKSQPFVLGNVISYVGLSMLMQYDYTSRKDVNQLILDNKPPPPLFTKSQSTMKVITETETDPNGIPIKYVASAPGDPISRFCLRSPDLEATTTFYTSVFGMNVVAEDERMVCLRLPATGRRVPTTLVFEQYDGELEYGNCFDHLVVGTNDLQKIEDRATLNAIFMTPRTMFGSTVMGLTDSNGYKIYVTQR